MIKVYKYVLAILIIAATGYLTYEHYTDPIYNLRVGTTVNSDAERIEDRGVRFLTSEAALYIGFNTRLETGTTVVLQIKNEDLPFNAVVKNFYITPSYNFFYVKQYSFMLGPGTFTVSVYIDDELMESTTFIMEEQNLDH